MARTLKFAKGGRAEAQRDRRLADIESDYQKALARGKSEKEARAKREQRLADARDDYAKRTGADRTETRAAERAAEQRLTAARRSPDKDMKAVSVASEASKPATTKVDITTKVDTPTVSNKPAPKATPRPAPKPVRRAAPKPAPKAAPKPASGATPKSSPKPDVMASYRAAAARNAAESPEVKKRTSQLLSGPITDPRSVSAKEMENRSVAEKQAIARRRAAALGLKPARFREPVSTRYAKGGKVDGAAVRGKTRGMRKK